MARWTFWRNSDERTPVLRVNSSRSGGGRGASSPSTSGHEHDGAPKRATIRRFTAIASTRLLGPPLLGSGGSSRHSGEGDRLLPLQDVERVYTRSTSDKIYITREGFKAAPLSLFQSIRWRRGASVPHAGVEVMKRLKVGEAQVSRSRKFITSSAPQPRRRGAPASDSPARASSWSERTSVDPEKLKEHHRHDQCCRWRVDPADAHSRMIESRKNSSSGCA